MPGKFKIIEDRSDAIKFRGMVSFNDKPAEYHEVDLDVVDRAVESLEKDKAELEVKAAKNPEKYEESIDSVEAEIATLESKKSDQTEYINAQLQATADADFEKIEKEKEGKGDVENGKLIG